MTNPSKGLNDVTSSKSIIDCHVHLFSPDLHKEFYPQLKAYGIPQQNMTFGRWIEFMNSRNIDESLIVSSAYIFHNKWDKVRNENDYILNQCVKAWTANAKSMRNEMKSTMSAKNTDDSQQKKTSNVFATFSIDPKQEHAIDEIKYQIKQLKIAQKRLGLNCESIAIQSQRPILKLHFSNSNFDFRNLKDLKKMAKIFSIMNKENGSILLHFDNVWFSDADIGIAHKDAYVDTNNKLMINSNSTDNYNGPKIDEYIENFVNICYLPHCHNLKLMFAHLGGFGGFNQRNVEILNAFLNYIEKIRKTENSYIYNNLKSNVYFDVSSIFFQEKPIIDNENEFYQCLKKIERLGLSDNILWGSDTPFINWDQYYNWTKKFLSQKWFNKIMYQNKHKLKHFAIACHNYNVDTSTNYNHDDDNELNNTIFLKYGSNAMKNYNQYMQMYSLSVIY